MNAAHRHRVSLGAIAVVIALVAAGCGTPGPSATASISPAPATAEPTRSPAATAPSATQSPAPPSLTPPPTSSPPPTATPAPTPAPSGSPSGSPGPTIVFRAYFLLESADGNPKLVPVLREVPETQAVARAALTELFAGPTAEERAATPRILSVIPEGTGLLGVRIEDGLATVDLTREFESGGGSMAMFGRLAQVVYTATQFSTVTSVALELDGEPVTVFSGEGIELRKPLTREMYRDDWLPAIFVDRPAWGAALGHPGRVTGLANVFEAVLMVTLLDRNGEMLTEETVMATCGTGCWGDFRVDLTYDVATAQWGTLRVWAASARDGEPEDAREYPVWLTPAP